MALSLQDLLVGFDAGAPQAPRVNAPAPRGTPAHDPFAALFAAQSTSTTTNSAPAPRSTPAPQASQPPAPAADTARPQRPASANADQNQNTDTASTKPTDKTAGKTDTASTSSTKPTRADDTNAKASGAKASDDAATDDSGNHDIAPTANATPAGVAPVVVDVIQMAQLANAPTSDGDSDVGAAAPVAGATAPGLLIANDIARGAKSAPAATTDAAPATPVPDRSGGANALADQPTKGDKPATDIASLLAAFTAPDQSAPTTDTKVAEATAKTPSTDTSATASAAPPATTPTDPKPSQSNGTPAPQASAVAQVAVQAPRDPRATADAVRQVTGANDSTPQAATVAQAIQIARPNDTGKTAAARSDATSKSAAHATKTDGDDTTSPNAPAKDATIANAVTPTAKTVDPTPVATVAAMPAPTTADGDDAQAPAQTATTTAPIAGASAGAPQVHQLYTKAAANAPTLPQVTVDQVVAHVAKAADDGIDRLTIQLKPLHLGAIEVKLEMHDDGGLAKATISADRPDTLDLLQRDSHRLERALENAGIKADTGSLSFNLRGDGGRQQPTFTQNQNAAPSSRPTYTSDDTGLDTSVIAYLNSRTARGGVDIRV